jgi:hypothetical protein
MTAEPDYYTKLRIQRKKINVRNNKQRESLVIYFTSIFGEPQLILALPNGD